MFSIEIIGMAAACKVMASDLRLGQLERATTPCKGYHWIGMRCVNLPLLLMTVISTACRKHRRWVLPLQRWIKQSFVVAMIKVLGVPDIMHPVGRNPRSNSVPLHPQCGMLRLPKTRGLAASNSGDHLQQLRH